MSWAGNLLRRLGRVTSGGAFVPEIDGLRFVAISAVFFFHLNGYLLAKVPPGDSPGAFNSMLMTVFDRGKFGVELFFAISGFILALPFAARHLEGAGRVSLRQYYLRRVTRLEPPYIINALLVFGLLVAVNKESAGELLPHLGASLVYLHNLIYQRASDINFVAWSLEIEVQFYLLAPFLTMVFAIRSPLGRRAAIAIGMLLFMTIQQIVPMAIFSILKYGQYFLVGFLLADLFLADWKRAPSRSWRFDALSITAWVSFVFVLGLSEPLKLWLTPWLMLVAYIGAFRGVLLNSIFRNGWIVAIGGMCYTIYLYHFYVISFVGRWSISIGAGQTYWIYLLVQAVIHCAIAFVVCSILFLAFEKPFMRRDWPARFWRRITNAPPAQTSPQVQV